MAEFQNTIDLFGDDIVATSIIDRSIEEFNDDVLNEVGGYAFYKCTSLASVNLPKVTTLNSSAFGYCEKLASVNIPLLTEIGQNAFLSCTFSVLVLRSESVCTTNVSYGFPKGGVTVYVPQSLIESYKTATNWSKLYADGTCNFVAIEGSEYE